MTTILIILFVAALGCAVAEFFCFRHQKEEKDATADIDLRGNHRPKLTVQLPHGRKLTLTTPTKAMSDALAPLGALLDRLGSGDTTAEAVAELYRYSAMLLGQNKEHKPVNAQRLERMLTPDDCIDFIGQYLTWLAALTNRKN